MKYSSRKTISSEGFSLIEVLVVLAIFSALSLVVSQTLFTTMKGAAKSEVNSNLKQEANFIFSVMERALHNASQITSCSETYINYNDMYSQPGKFDCSSGAVASGSANLTSSSTVVTGCFIQCSPNKPPFKTVDINMTFEKKDKTDSLLPEEKSRIQLKTKVILRN